MPADDVESPIECDLARTRMFESADGLGHDELARHLEACPPCRAYEAAMRDLGRDVGALDRAPLPAWRAPNTALVPSGALVRVVSPLPSRLAPAPAPFQAEQQGSLARPNALTLMRRRMWLIGAATILSCAGTALYTLQVTPEYEATAQLLLEPTKPIITPGGATQVVGDASYYTTQIQLLRSERIARLTLVRLGIQRLPGQTGLLGQEALVALMVQSTSVRLAADSRLFDVSFRSSDADFAARVANGIVESYIDDTRTRTSTVSDLALEQLREKARDLAPRVQAAQEKLQAFLATTPMTTALGSERALAAQLDQYRSQLGAVQVERETRDQLARLLAANDFVPVQPHPQLGALAEQLRTELVAVRAAIDQLLATYNADHPEVKQARTRLDFLAQTYAAELKRQADRNALELALVSAREQALTKQIADLERIIADVASHRAQQSALAQEATTLRDTYDGVLGRIDQIDLARGTALAGENAFIVERARAPRLPTWPNVPLNLVLGLAAGAFVGAALAISLGVRDDCRTRDADGPC